MVRASDPNNNASSTGWPIITIDTTFETSLDDASKVQLAVRARNICLTYGSGSKANYVLNNLSISVPAGAIYGLLGPSGCGKTSLLKIISGLMRPDTGVVKVFGAKPGSENSGVPGSGIGYMPQDIALLPDLTVREMMSYFGSLHFMGKKLLHKQINDLIALLEIPDPNRLVIQMSGGQQRRLSLACTILHKPRLCILDEPTVGVDPMLCSRIWELLVNLSAEYNMTIIITTHYIEECRKAAVVGFMRKGEILEEGPPNKLIARFNVETLEDVFYQICLAQKRRNSTIHKAHHHRKSLAIAYDDNRLDKVEKFRSYRSSHSIIAFFISIYVLVWRYMLQIIRQPVFLLILFVFPSFALGIIIIGIGGAPKDVPVAWIVQESPEYGFLHAKPENYHKAFANYQTPFYPEALRDIFDTKILKLIEYGNLDDAIQDIKSLKIKAAILFKKGFSDAFHERITPFNHKDLSSDTINRGTIYLYGDMTDVFTMTTLELTLKLGLFKLMNSTAIATNAPPESRRLPFEIGKPIYGKLFQKDNFGLQDYAAPGFLVTITYGCSLAISALGIAADQADKMFDRNFATGITVMQMLVAQIIARFSYLTLSSLFALLATIFIFKVPCEGNFWLAYALTALQTMAGTTNGMMFGALFPKIENLVFIACGAMLFVVFVGGIFWPIDCLPYYFKWLSVSLPFTLPAQALRSVLIRQGAPFMAMVYPGIVMSVVWCVVFFIITYLVLVARFRS